MSPAPKVLAAVLAGLAVAAGALMSCVVGKEEQPGCHTDDECGAGLSCRAGACFGLTTGLSPPHDPASASDASDADAPD